MEGLIGLGGGGVLCMLMGGPLMRVVGIESVTAFYVRRWTSFIRLREGRLKNRMGKGGTPGSHHPGGQWVSDASSCSNSLIIRSMIVQDYSPCMICQAQVYVGMVYDYTLGSKKL